MGTLSPQAKREADFMFDDNIIAKPLAPAGIEAVVSKNPALYFRWVNVSFQNGYMYEQAKAKGFVNAAPVDVEVPGIAFKDGAFKSGDLLLVKMDRNKALGAMKHDALRALRTSGSGEDAKTGARVLKETLGEVARPAVLKSRMSTFVPGEKELRNLTGG